MKDVFKDKTVLVTGGTGFLGRELVTRILKHDPHSIRVFSRDEFKHHKLQTMLPDERIRHLIGDVRDYRRLMRATKGVDIVIHAAALKRIDLVEYNVSEAIKTNVMGTINMARACLENEVDKSIFISTDKACSPVNSYGATKFLGERIFIESNFNRGSSKTALLTTRYGNVLASTGSVIPFFIQKIKNKEKIPITDEEMTRFVISAERAVQEVFTSIKHGVGGETFIPKLQSLKIMDLVDVLRDHYGDADIENIGLRPGEKIHEELINEEEAKRCYELDDDYVIISQIERYQAGIRFPYLDKRKTINFDRYISSNGLMSKKEIENMLKGMGLLE